MALEGLHSRSRSPLFEPPVEETPMTSIVPNSGAVDSLAAPVAMMTPSESQVDSCADECKPPLQTLLDNTSSRLGENQMSQVAMQTPPIKAEFPHTQFNSISQTTHSSARTPIVPHKRKASEIDLDELGFDDDDDEYDDEVERHDPASEPFPRLPIYHPSFEKAEFRSGNIIHRFRNMIKTGDYKDGETEYLLTELSALAHPPYDLAIRVGMIGDSGVGKSSLINSLLGAENIAPQGDDGESCTFVVQEFIQHPQSQKVPFAAEVEFFTRKSCTSMIADHLKNYVEFHCSSGEIEDDESELAELQARTALETFMALFSGHDEFSDEDKARNFLATATSPDDTNILLPITKWTEAVLEKLSPNGEKTKLFASNIQSLTDQTLPFTKTVAYATVGSSSLRCSPWPFVKVVRICLDSPILKQGIILVDLPGISDVNRSRVDATKSYLQRCEYSLVVGPIHRAETDTSIHKNLIEAFRRKRGGSVIMACTRSDDIGNSNKARQAIQLTETEEELMNSIDNRLLSTAARSNDINSQLKAAKGDKSRVRELSRIKDALKLHKISLQHECMEVRIVSRNKKVARGLQQKYRDLTKDEYPLPVFCVSNKEYTTHIIGFDKLQPPVLSVLETGIPRLRAHLYALPAKGKFNTLEHYCRTSLEALLNTIEMSCSVSKLKRKEHLSRIVAESRKKGGERINDVFESFRRNEIDAVLEAIRKREMVWISMAGRKCAKWAKWNAAGHKAFVRQNGNWKTKKYPKENWNEALLEPVKIDIDPVFDRFFEDCHTFSIRITEALGDVISDMERVLNDDPAASLSGAVTIFMDNLKQRRKEIDKQSESVEAALKKFFNTIKIRATTDGTTYYFSVAMAKAYAKCLQATAGQGRNAHQNRCEEFEELVCEANGVYMAIHNGVLTDGESILDKVRKNLIRNIDALFKKIQSDFDFVSSGQEDETPEGREFRKKLRAMVPAAREELRTSVRDCLEDCRLYKT